MILENNHARKFDGALELQKGIVAGSSKHIFMDILALSHIQLLTLLVLPLLTLLALILFFLRVCQCIGHVIAATDFATTHASGFDSVFPLYLTCNYRHRYVGSVLFAIKCNHCFPPSGLL